MPEIAKTLIVIGVIFVAGGLVLLAAGKIPWLGRLPGDILIKKENFTFYFSLATSILLSIIASLILFLLHRRS